MGRGNGTQDSSRPGHLSRLYPLSPLTVPGDPGRFVGAAPPPPGAENYGECARWSGGTHDRPAGQQCPGVSLRVRRRSWGPVSTRRRRWNEQRKKVIISVSPGAKADRTARVAARRARGPVHAGSPAFLSAEPGRRSAALDRGQSQRQRPWVVLSETETRNWRVSGTGTRSSRASVGDGRLRAAAERLSCRPSRFVQGWLAWARRAVLLAPPVGRLPGSGSAPCVHVPGANSPHSVMDPGVGPAGEDSWMVRWRQP